MTGFESSKARVSGLVGRLTRSGARVAMFVACASLMVQAGQALAQKQDTSADAPPAAAPTRIDDVSEPWRTDRFYLETSLRSYHFSSDPNHVSNQKLILGEWNVTDHWLVGGSFFDNSFGQPSQYFYGGYRFRPIESQQPFYVKVSAGLVHGYTGAYQDKIPYNHSGVAPVVVPSIGYCVGRICSEMVVFGGAGVLFTLGVTIP